MSSYLVNRLTKTAGIAQANSYVGRQRPGPGNWFERNVPFMEPSMADRARYYGERGARYIGDAGRYMMPTTGAEAGALAATAAATGMFGDTAKALSPIGAAAPLFAHLYQGGKLDIQDPALQRAAIFAALPLLGKGLSGVFGERRLAMPRVEYTHM